MKIGRIKDPLYKDYQYYLGISHLPSSHLLRPSIIVKIDENPKAPINGTARV